MKNAQIRQAPPTNAKQRQAKIGATCLTRDGPNFSNFRIPRGISVSPVLRDPVGIPTHIPGIPTHIPLRIHTYTIIPIDLLSTV